MKPEFLKFLKRGLRQGSWPLIQRYLVAPKILQLPPIEFARSSNFCVQMLLCERDAIIAHWSLRSLYQHWRGPLQVIIHHNDQCSAETLKLLQEKFRNVHLVSREMALRELSVQLRGFPLLLRWREQSYCAIKALDYYFFGEGKYSVFLDPDVLFFSEPSEVFTPADDDVWMRDNWYALAIEPEESVRLFGGSALPVMNTGLGRANRRAVNLKLLNDIHQHLYEPSVVLKWKAKGIPEADMAYNAILSCQTGQCNLLPDSYQLAAEPGLQGIVAKHYVTPARFGMFEEGIPRVAQQLGMELPRWYRARM